MLRFVSVEVHILAFQETQQLLLCVKFPGDENAAGVLWSHDWNRISLKLSRSGFSSPEKPAIDYGKELAQRNLKQSACLMLMTSVPQAESGCLLTGCLIWLQ